MGWFLELLLDLLVPQPDPRKLSWLRIVVLVTMAVALGALVIFLARS